MTLQVTIGFAVGSSTVSDTALAISHANFGFSAGDLAAAERALITVIDDAVRWRKDGLVVPTASLGHYQAKDARPLVISGQPDITNLTFIRVTTDAVVFIELEKFK
jgi:hypothetical protein